MEFIGLFVMFAAGWTIGYYFGKNEPKDDIERPY